MPSTFLRRLLRSAWLYVVLGLGGLALVSGLLAANWLYNHDDRVRFRVQTYWSSFSEWIDPQPALLVLGGGILHGLVSVLFLRDPLVHG